MSEWSMDGKVVLITGAAGGIGAATAKELAQRGAQCVLADVDQEGLQRTAQALGGDPLTVRLDVTDADACERAVAQAVERHGGLDVIWANAGIATFGPVLRTDPDAFTRTVEINLLGVYRTVHAALPHVVERRGYVAVTASLATFAHAPGMSAYSATKAGVEAFCNSLRVEVAHLGVDVATIHPSWIATDMVKEGDTELRSFRRLRDAMPPPLSKTYPVERAARDIARGFDRRARRICTPGWVQAVAAFRSVLTTRAAERNTRAVAPEVDRLFAEEAAERGTEGASMSRRVLDQQVSRRS